MKVLIVDDSEAMHHVIKGLIKDHVNEFVEGWDGSEALQLYREHRPDLVLMDLSMKEINGIQATLQIRAEFPDARVFIISALDTLELQTLAQEIGVSTFISKANLSTLKQLLVLLT